MDIRIIGLCIVVVAILINRKITSGAAEKLSDADRETVTAIYSSMKKISLIPILIIFVSYFVMLGLFQNHLNAVTSVYMSVLMAYALITYGLIAYKIHKSNLPREYVKKFISGRSIVFLSLAVFFALLLYSRKGLV